ncbi:MAG: hypothetical protein HY434_01650 [Candidatus Liptonbacteria bacterium]|nr:hypothetical protein [Candidatus Liptonbacteria bacterium]
MRRETPENFFEDKLDPDALGIEIDQIEACALEEARDKNQAAFYKMESEFSDEESVIGSAIEPGDIPSIIYPQKNKNRVLCYQLAKLELSRLEHPDARTYCSHSIEDHKKAIRSIIAKLPEQASSKAN